MSQQMAIQVQRQNPISPAGGILQRSCDNCIKKRYLQRKARQEPSEMPAIAHEVLQILDQPPVAPIHTYMEPNSGHDFSRISSYTPIAGVIQTKLAINRPGDEYEQEADRIADQVMAAPAHEIVSGAKPRIQRFPTQLASQVEAVPASVDHVLASPGKPLEPTLRKDMEEHFGYDFSRVRVHTGTLAEQSSRDINANAYTAGNNIVFDADRFAPETHDGKRLIAHELTHVMQQTGADGIRTYHGQFPFYSVSVATSAKNVINPVIQREMKFEIQTPNRIRRNDGEKKNLLERKYGPDDFLFKGNTGVRLESESHGVLEFETKWEHKWSKLKKQLEEAVAMTEIMNKINSIQKDDEGWSVFPFDVSHLRKGSEKELKRGYWGWRSGKEGRHEKILRKDEKLEVKITDSSWRSGIQSSEGILLSQYESLLREHEFPAYREPVIVSAQKILDDTNIDKIPEADLVNLRSFLQIIINYIMRGQGGPASASAGAFADVKTLPAKQAFILMNRTDFSWIYQTLLSKNEQSLFKRIVQKDEILKKLRMNRKTPFFIKGHAAGRGPTVYKWLEGICEGKDLLSIHNVKISNAMGRYPEKGEENTKLVKFETRNTMRNPWREAKDWVAYAEELFKYAAEKRKRSEIADDPATPRDENEETTLIYDPEVTHTQIQVHPNFNPTTYSNLELSPKLTLTSEDETKAGLLLELRKFLPSLLDGKLQPLVYIGVGTGGISAGMGASFDPFAEMALFLTGKGGIHTNWFKAIEVGGGLEAGWAFGKNRSLRLGIGWDIWQGLDADKQRTHIASIFFGKRF